VLFNELGSTVETLRFETLSGTLTVKRLDDGRLEMDFPAYVPKPIAITTEAEAVLGIRPVALFDGPALIAQLPDEASVRNCVPDLSRLSYYEGDVYKERHIIITALADADQPYDVVSRFFAPGLGVEEDPATGSMHCILPALYAALTGKTLLDYYQAHPRRGAHIQAELIGSRVKIRGRALSIARSDLLI
jgi:predicted PhzF superfamily epimerase YddE/YHI9